MNKTLVGGRSTSSGRKISWNTRTGGIQKSTVENMEATINAMKVIRCLETFLCLCASAWRFKIHLSTLGGAWGKIVPHTY